MRNYRHRLNNSGVALVTVLVITAVALALGYAALTISLSVLQGSKAAESSVQARLNAESGLDLLFVGLSRHLVIEGKDIRSFTNADIPKTSQFNQDSFTLLTPLPITNQGPEFRFAIEGRGVGASKYLSTAVIEHHVSSGESTSNEYIPGISEIIQDLPSSLNIGSPSAGVSNLNNTTTKVFIDGGYTSSNFITFRSNLNVFAECTTRDAEGICINYRIFEFNEQKDSVHVAGKIGLTSPGRLNNILSRCMTPSYSDEFNIQADQFKFLCQNNAFVAADSVELSENVIKSNIMSLSDNALNKDLVAISVQDICDDIPGCSLSNGRIRSCTAQNNVFSVTNSNINTWRTNISPGQTVCFMGSNLFLESLGGGFDNINVIVNGSVTLRNSPHDILNLSNSSLIVTGSFSNQTGSIGDFHNANIVANDAITLPRNITASGLGNIVSVDGSIRIDGAIVTSVGGSPEVNIIARDSIISYNNSTPTKINNMIAGQLIRYDSNYHVLGDMISYSKVNLQGSNYYDKRIDGNVLSSNEIEIRAPIYIAGAVQSLGTITLSPGDSNSNNQRVLNIKSGVISLKKTVLNGHSSSTPRINVFAGLVSNDTIEFNGTIRVLGPVYSKNSVSLSSQTIVDYGYLNYLRGNDENDGERFSIVSRR